MAYNKNSKRYIKKRRASLRKNNKYQIGGTKHRKFVKVFINTYPWEKDLIINMHKQVENIDDIDKNANNIKTIFNKPTTDVARWSSTVGKIEKENKTILQFVASVMYQDPRQEVVSWAFLAMYISITYLVDTQMGVKLAFLLYNSKVSIDNQSTSLLPKFFKSSPKMFIDTNENEVIDLVLEYINKPLEEELRTWRDKEYEPLPWRDEMEVGVGIILKRVRNDNDRIRITLYVEPSIYELLYSFTVRTEQIDYIKSIGDTRKTQINHHRHFYNTIDKDVISWEDKEKKKYREREREREKRKAEKQIKKNAAIEKLKNIKKRMPIFIKDEYFHGDLWCKNYKYYRYDGKPISYEDFKKNEGTPGYEEIEFSVPRFSPPEWWKHELFELATYGWTKEDAEDIKYVPE
jgi:hypothetical protein